MSLAPDRDDIPSELGVPVLGLMSLIYDQNVVPRLREVDPLRGDHAV